MRGLLLRCVVATNSIALLKTYRFYTRNVTPKRGTSGGAHPRG